MQKEATPQENLQPCKTIAAKNNHRLLTTVEWDGVKNIMLASDVSYKGTIQWSCPGGHQAPCPERGLEAWTTGGPKGHTAALPWQVL